MSRSFLYRAGPTLALAAIALGCFASRAGTSSI